MFSHIHVYVVETERFLLSSFLLFARMERMEKKRFIRGVWVYSVE